jgi:diguanylate cyclase (GGDEF)-like protein
MYCGVLGALHRRCVRCPSRPPAQRHFNRPGKRVAGRQQRADPIRPKSLFWRSPLSRAVLLGVPLLTAAWFHYWNAVEPALAPRLAFHAAYVFITSSLGAWACLTRGPSHEPARRLLGWILVAHGVFAVLAVRWLIPAYPHDGNLFALGAYVSVRSLEGIVANVFFVVLVVQLVAERLHARLAEDAMTDSLTGLFNRRGFYETTRREILRRDESRYVVMVVALDIDWFKRVNDEYGHAGGDEALECVAHVLKNTVRLAELVGRIGGEEFAITVRLHHESQSKGLGERLSAAVEAMRIPLPDGRSISITLSRGYSCADLRQHKMETESDVAELLETLLSRADKALYTAKDAGRHRCVIKRSRSIPKAYPLNQRCLLCHSNVVRSQTKGVGHKLNTRDKTESAKA